MKKVSLFILFMLTLVSTSFAEVPESKIYFRAGATVTPEQDITVTAPGTGGTKITMSDSLGGLAEVGVYSPGQLLSFGILGTATKLRAFNPAPGVEALDAELYSARANMCAHVQNKSAFTPYVCGSAGVFWLTPDATLTNGANIALDSANGLGYGVSGGVKYAATNSVALFAGVNWEDTFKDLRSGIKGAPGTGADVDIGQFRFEIGAEF